MICVGKKKRDYINEIIALLWNSILRRVIFWKMHFYNSNIKLINCLEFLASHAGKAAAFLIYTYKFTQIEEKTIVLQCIEWQTIGPNISC